MHKFWYEYVKLKYGEKAKLFYRQPYSLQKKIESIYVDIAKGV